MSFLKRLFGGMAAPVVVFPSEEYRGFTIQPTPFAEGGQHQTCGVISRTVDGQVREKRFVRADRFATSDDAAAHSLRKARQIIDEQGDRLFDE